MNYQPQTVTAHPTLPEIAVGGKVRGRVGCALSPVFMLVL